MSHITLLLEEPLKGMLLEAFQKLAQDFLSEQPKPDLQYTCEQVAGILNLNVDTVRNYLKLPTGHRRHLSYVKTSDSPRGNRIRLSAVQHWQERNEAERVEQAESTPLAIRPTRASNRRRR